MAESQPTLSAQTPARSGQARERVLAETFVSLADTLVDEYDVVDLLDRLVASCLDLLDVTAAGLLLVDEQDTLVVVASTTEETRLLEVFQVQQNEGPCLECVHTGVAVASGDIAEQRQRWPQFAPAAIEVGFHSVAAVPLRLRAHTIGALNLFNVAPALITPSDQLLAQALADVATIGILQQRSIERSTVVAEQLQHALKSRIAVEQAKGVLAERNSMTMEDAFAALRAHARNHNLKLTDVAVSIVQGELPTDQIIPRSAGA